MESIKNGVKPGRLLELLKNILEFKNALKIRKVHDWNVNLETLAKTMAHCQWGCPYSVGANIAVSD